MSRNMQQIAQIAIFMDFTALSESFELGKFTSKIRQYGRLLVQKAYVDTTRYNVLKKEMSENAVQLCELPFSDMQNVTETAVRLTVDVLETAFMKTYIDTYILCVGENEYTALFSKLRSLNKHIIVISETEKWQEIWRKYCDEVIGYEAFIDKKEPIEIVQMPANASTINRSAPRSVYGMLKHAVSTLTAKEEVVYDWQIQEYIQTISPEFKVEEYNFKTWEGLWEKAKSDCVIDYNQTDKGLEIKLFNPLRQEESYQKLMAESMVLFYKSAIMCPTFDDNKITLSDIAIGMRRIMPTYNPPTTTTRGRGFKAIMLEAESKGYLNVFSVPLQGSIQYSVQLLPKFHEDFGDITVLNNSESKPIYIESRSVNIETKPIVTAKTPIKTQFQSDNIAYTHILAELNLCPDLNVVKFLYDKIDEYVFSAHQNEDVSIKDVYSYCIAQAKDKESLCKKAFNTILGSNLLFTANNVPITKVYMPLIVEEMEVYEDAEPQIKAFIKKQIEIHLGQPVIESKLNELFYGKMSVA